MGLSAFARGILILALGLSTQVVADVADIAACSRSVKAQQGDTCASLATAAGISVAQFLRSNPSVSSCSALTAGATYCLEGTATAAPVASSTTSTSSPTTAPLKISTDGTCGAGVTCSGSSFGTCCSAHGFCGSTADYCGEGCQAGLGTCGSDTGPITTAPSPGTATATVTVTSITVITRASITLQTSTTVVTSTAVATRTVVQTVPATALTTRTATETVTATTTQTARATVLTTSVVTLTSIILSTSTSTSVAVRTTQTTVTQTAKVTSVVIETLTTIKTVTITAINTIGCNNGGPSFVTTIFQPTTRPTTTGRPVITTVTQLPTRPTPYLPGSSRSCKSYDQIQRGDTCRQIANRNSVSLLDFYELNPSVSANRDPLRSLLCTPDLIELLLNGLCQIDCDDLWPGYFVCVGV